MNKNLEKELHMIKNKLDVDNGLVITVFAAISSVMLAWNCLVIYDIKRDVKQIKITVNDMHETLTEMTQPQIDIVETDISSEANLNKLP
tara:strand:+ start:871 stop:1137 length:267 start_codon:yes stop_codon:yes gene_type:complete